MLDNRQNQNTPTPEEGNKFTFKGKKTYFNVKIIIKMIVQWL